MLTVAPRIVNDVSYVACGSIMRCVTFAWQAQHLVKFSVTFRGRRSMKFGMIAGAGNVVFCCSWRVRKVASARGGLFAFSGSDHDVSRIMLGSVAHWK